MNTKLTLTIEKEVIEKAKEFAKSNQISLSNMIENYLKSVITNKKKVRKTETPITDSLRGSFKMKENFNYKKEKLKRLEEKYSL